MAANVRNYISAGNAAVNKAVQARRALADNKARMDEIGMQAVSEDAKTRVNTAANNASTAKQSMLARTNEKLAEIDIETDKAIADSKRGARKAGLLAGGVAMLGVGAMYKNRKDEPDAQLSILDSQRAKIGEQLADNASKTAASEAELERLNKLNPAGTEKPSVETAPVPQGDQGDGSDGWARWRNVISLGEGTQGDEGYNIMFGGRRFENMSAHPNNPMATPWGTKSEAAGKYQFMKPTWDRAKSALNLPDFGRESQEKAGRWLATNRGLDYNTRITDFETFKKEITKISPEWASMPSLNHGGGSYYGQGAISFEEAWNAYNR